jgi:phage gpG-like protein
MIEFLVANETQIIARITGAADRVAAEIMDALNTVNTQLQRHISSDKLHGQVLSQRSGNLRHNILKINATMEEGNIVGAVALGANAKYGLAHEFGAHIPERVPVTSKALHWIGKSGEQVFAMRARAFDLPERSFMRSSFEEFRDRIEADIRAAVHEAAV